MRFGETAVGEACGHVLAHGLRLPDGVMKKGRVLDEADVQRLIDAGHSRIVTACLEADDVPEDAAAEALAAALAGDGMRVAAPFTGRCNLFATGRGLLDVDVRRIDAVNRVHESLTVATLDAPQLVAGRQMLATIKVIPFATPRHALERAIAAAAGGTPAVTVRALRGLRAGLVQTRLEGTRESVLDKTTRVLGARLEGLDIALAGEERCDHAAAPVAQCVARQLDAGCDLVLVAGASAIVDRRDVIPEGIGRAGGELVHFGMPVDPGNLLLLARRGDAVILGLPGCARSPKYNGLDMVLERLAAGIGVGAADVMRMGVGGLLKEIPERPQPRGGEASAASAPRVSALVLAAGQSRRMGSSNKLLAEVDGQPMVRVTVENIAHTAVERILVVTGHEAGRVREALGGLDVDFVNNPHFASGLSTSLARGVAALDDTADAVLVCLGDMPRVRPRHVERLLAAFDPVEGRSICVPTHRGKRGNPVLWDRRYLAEMTDVRGDVGARALIGAYEDQVCEVEMDDPGVLMDVDSPAALAALTGAATPD